MPSHNHHPYRTPAQPDRDARWDYSQLAVDVAGARRHAERQRGRLERHTINRDTPIIGGVYEGSYGGEAIVVDYERNPQYIDAAVDKVLEASRGSNGRIRKGHVLGAVYDRVAADMRYDSAAVDKLFEERLGGVDHRKVSLNAYIVGDERGGFGECRHQALYAGAISEQLVNLGVMNGQVSVERNMVKRPDDDKYDGHSWARYTSSSGEVCIIDVAQHQFGTLEEMMRKNRQSPNRTWDYARPEDKKRAAGRHAVRIAGVHGD
ncbi:MAG TPA: hypothetical protein VLH14_01330 [Patescibacteria group bacterium]|nr:hypothetical protein [Patescibacteria group bacterium]